MFYRVLNTLLNSNSFFCIVLVKTKCQQLNCCNSLKSYISGLKKSNPTIFTFCRKTCLLVFSRYIDLKNFATFPGKNLGKIIFSQFTSMKITASHPACKFHLKFDFIFLVIKVLFVENY